jgi:hypothetical protein
MENLVSALAKAQANMSNATLNKINPHFRSRYADLSAIRDAVVPALSEQGVALIQIIETREHGTVVVTRLMKGEEVLSSECPVIVSEKCKPQEFGSALTYARRYSMAAIAGISADEDDDANAAQDSTQNGVAKPKTRPAPIAPNVPTIPVSLKEDGTSDWETFAQTFKAEVEKINDLGALNAFMRAHNGAISNLGKHAPNLHEEIAAFTKNRRSFLAQAPIEQKAG